MNPISAIVLLWGYCACSNCVPHFKPHLLLSLKPSWKLRSRSVSLTGLVANQIVSVICCSWGIITNLHSGLTLVWTIVTKSQYLGLWSQFRTKFIGITDCDEWLPEDLSQATLVMIGARCTGMIPLIAAICHHTKLTFHLCPCPEHKGSAICFIMT